MDVHVDMACLGNADRRLSFMQDPARGVVRRSLVDVSLHIVVATYASNGLA